MRRYKYSDSHFLSCPLRIRRNVQSHVSSTLDNHLRNTLSAQRLTAYKFLLFQSCERVARPRKSQHDRRGNQAARADDDAEPLYQGHGAVDSSAHVIRREAADENVELGGRGTDSQQERDFDEYEDERGAAAQFGLVVMPW